MIGTLLLLCMFIPVAFIISRQTGKKIVTYKAFKLYFLFLSVIAIVISMYVILFLAPKFGNIFEDMNIQLPILTQWILTLSTLKLSIIISGVVLISLIFAILQNQNVEKAIQAKLSRNTAVISAIFIILLGLAVGVIVVGLFLPLHTLTEIVK